MVRIDEPRHDDAARCVDLRRVARLDVLSDGQDFLTFDQHIRLGEVADLLVQRHDGTAANDVAPTRHAAVHGRVVRRGGTRREQIEARSREPGRQRTLQKITPRAEMVPRHSFIAQFAHAGISLQWNRIVYARRTLRSMRPLARSFCVIPVNPHKAAALRQLSMKSYSQYQILAEG